MPGDVDNDPKTSLHVGPGVVTGNVVDKRKKVVFHAIKCNDEDGAGAPAEKHVSGTKFCSVALVRSSGENRKHNGGNNKNDVAPVP